MPNVQLQNEKKNPPSDGKEEPRCTLYEFLPVVPLV